MSMDVQSVRREYGALSLDETIMPSDPMVLCETWLKEAIATEPDPTAFVLSTMTKSHEPDARVILLKEILPEGFVFYTHYHSPKGQQLSLHPFAALTVYWPVLSRQIRIRGTVVKVAAQKSDAYFASRPYLSQLSAIVSPQSQVIPDRKILEQAIENLKEKLTKESLLRPSEWGGYLIQPTAIEFWQGRDNRLHDRILYQLCENTWQKCRLSP